MADFEPVLLARVAKPDSHRLEGYRADGGYATFERTLKEKKPEEVVAQVKDSVTGAYLLQGHFATGHGDADNYTENTATMNPDGTYYPSISGAAPINLSDMLKQAIGPEEGGYVTELGQAPMAVMSGGAIFTGNTVEDGDSVADLWLARHLGDLRM